jgi:mono/diheme cytochrome c family protein
MVHVAVVVALGVAMALAVAGVVAYADVGRDAEPAVTGAAAPVDGTRVAAHADPVALERGRVVYVQLCLPCHGARGDGRGEWAYRVIPRPSNLAAARTQRRSDDELFEIISEPRPGTPMIGWKKQLSPQQRLQLVAYVRHLGSGGAR